MDDVDMLLSIIENPTRRRILEALVREPHYPLQLSKRLGISQQAVVKNLNLLERNGMVVSYRESSSIGPVRTVYQPSSEFTLVVDMRSGMFVTRVLEPSEGSEYAGERTVPNNDFSLEEVRRRISDIDGKMEELERKRSALLGEREDLLSSSMDRLSEGDYSHRYLLYELLNCPEAGLRDISKKFNANEETVREMAAEIDIALGAQEKEMMM
ncbi:MAG: helix-turn-helix domain-containing protein [Candidatus Methanomethylophilaceae archaeon]|jgi:predicted transcriptional regulator|nr:helix-turn-helix domain-containing protein [Candidatus Methanomethylophilaceae archaeon]NLF33352.1 helix-turn-helix domain-containing protein [Thermoplasmatales archaeon]